MGLHPHDHTGTFRMPIVLALVVSVLLSWVVTLPTQHRFTDVGGRATGLGVIGQPEQVATQVASAFGHRAIEERWIPGGDPTPLVVVAALRPVVILALEWCADSTQRCGLAAYTRPEARAPPASQV